MTGQYWKIIFARDTTPILELLLRRPWSASLYACRRNARRMVAGGVITVDARDYVAEPAFNRLWP